MGPHLLDDAFSTALMVCVSLAMSSSSSRAGSATSPGWSASHAATGARCLAKISGLSSAERIGSSSWMRHCKRLTVAVR